MCSNPDFPARRGRIGPPAALLAVALLAACSVSAPPPKARDATDARSSAQPAATSSSSPQANAGQPAPVTKLPGTAEAPAASPAGEALVRVLAYADRVRTMNAAELGQEVARLGHAATPAEQLQLALALSQLRQTPELIRAQETLTRLLANNDPEAQLLHPLARLLAARYGEQRRFEDLLDKQTQQTRDVQRRLDQTNERLEALKAIERSLTSRTPASAPPASRPRTTP